jgi:hypothetical protein
VHLLHSTNARQVFVSDGVSMQSLFDETGKLLAQDGFIIQVLDVSQFEDLYNDEAGPAREEVRLWSFGFISLALMLVPQADPDATPPVLQLRSRDVCVHRTRTSPFLCERFFWTLMERTAAVSALQRTRRPCFVSVFLL